MLPAAFIKEAVRDFALSVAEQSVQWIKFVFFSLISAIDKSCEAKVFVFIVSSEQPSMKKTLVCFPYGSCRMGERDARPRPASTRRAAANSKNTADSQSGLPTIQVWGWNNSQCI